MTGRDDIILEFLAESDSIHNKRGLEINFEELNQPVSYSTLKRRLPKLRDAGLVEVVEEDGAWYRITDKGIQYLEGELDLSDEPEPTVD